jgi:hypothetical protein
MCSYVDPASLLVVSYGAGVDSTALLVEFVRRQIRPDYILFADTGGEKPETLAFLPLMATYLQAAGFPPITTVRYVPRDFKHWRPYHTLEENCLTTGTLPSLAFGFKSCSQKWKIAPQHRYLQHQEAIRAHWRRGGRVTQCIGFDAGPADLRRRAHRGDSGNRYYDYWYPLIDWGWDRARCVEEIAKAARPDQVLLLLLSSHQTNGGAAVAAVLMTIKWPNGHVMLPIWGGPRVILLRSQ